MDSTYLAYGQEVKELLNYGTAANFIEELWSIYSDCMAYQQEGGYNPRMSDNFLTFRELVFFFQRVGKLDMREFEG
jgi:hypothetical protein